MLRWIEGFDVNSHSSGDGFTSRYESVTLPSSLAFVNGRREATAYSATASPLKFSTPAFTDHATWVVGFAIAGQDPEPSDFIDFKKGGVHQVKLALTSDADQNLVFQVKRGATILGSYTLEKSFDFVQVEFKVLVHQTTGTYELRIEEVDVLSATGVNTADTGAGDADQVAFWFEINSLNDYMYVDDLYVCDGSGTANNDFLGEVVVEEFLALENGDTIEWLPKVPGEVNYEQVDDVGRHDGEDTYIAVSDIDKTDVFKFQGPDVISNVAGVSIEVVAAVETVPENFKLIAKFGASETASPNLQITSVAPVYESIESMFETNPDTSVAWTPEDIVLAQFGVRSAA